MASNRSVVDKFLSKYDTKNMKKDEIITTHTSFGTTCKKAYSIPDDKQEELFKLLYKAIFENNEQITLVERPKVSFSEDNTKIIIKPLVIDIDFKFSLEFNKRMYNLNHVKLIIELYNNAIRKYVKNLPQNKSIAAYLFERDKPYKNTGVFKDGLHIVYPEIITDTKIQFLIRNHVISNFNNVLNNKDYGEIPVTNNNVEDIVDKSVIEANGWFIYGCTKPNIDPYKLTHIFLSKYIEETNNYTLIEPKCNMSNEELMHYLSIRKKFNPEDVLVIKDEYVDLLATVSKKKEKIKIELTPEEQKYLNLANSGKYNSKQSMNLIEQSKLIEEATKLTQLLSDRRAYEFQTWIEVGMCLFNISDNLKATWIEFSKRCISKYKKAECEKWWNNFNKANLSIGSLHLWANIDNPTEYAKLKSSFLSSFILKSLTMTTQDIAQVLYELYKHQYIYVNISKAGEWYEFKNHKWHVCPNGISLRNKIGKEIMNEYLKLANHYNTIALNSIDDSVRDDAIDKSAKLTAVTAKLRDITFKKKIMEECVGFFANDDFIQNLDTNPYLIGFNNGIYDLSQMMFRDGRPEDMVSLSTNIDYPDYEYNEEEESIQKVLQFFAQIFPNPDTRVFTLKVLGSVLLGINLAQVFIIMTGAGANGKSLLNDFMANTLGDYAGTVSSSLITQKKKDSSSANPELIKLIGKRFCSMNEASKTEAIVGSSMKEIASNDRIPMRGLYQESRDVILQTKYFLTCNILPPIEGNDDAIWRRFIVLPFKSHFVMNPDPKNPYEFKRDNSLAEKMKNWREAFILVLIKYYKLFIDEGGYGKPVLDSNGDFIRDETGAILLKTPFEIETAINEYKNESNVYAQFAQDRLEKEEGSLLKLSEAYDAFTNWHMLNAIGGKPVSRPAFKKELERACLKNCYVIKGVNSGWHGWKVKKENDDQNPDFSKSEL